MDHKDSIRSRLSMSLLVHATLLWLLLTSLLLFVTTDAVWTSDEGALLYQAQRLAAGQGWEVPHPFPAADPTGTQFPIELTVWGSEDGTYLPYSRHAALVWLVGHVYLLFGYAGVVMVSIAGTVGASTAAAKIGHLIDTNPSTRLKTGLAAMWCTGIGSPMLFNSFIGWAHTLAAALLCWGFYLLVTSLAERDRAGSQRTLRMPRLLVGCALVFSACLLRSEAVLAGLAIGLAVVYVHRASKVGGFPIAGFGALGSTVAGLVVDKSLDPPNNGPLKPPTFDEVYGLIDGRLDGFYQTWLRPTTESGVTDLLLLVGTTLMIAAGFLARGHRPQVGSPPNSSKGPAVFASMGFALVLAAAGVLTTSGPGTVNLPSVLVPGLLVAFPSLFAGLLVTTKADLQNPILRGTALACGLFWIAVLGTQYRFGGGAEWGGRYFSATIPLAVPIAVSGCHRLIYSEGLPVEPEPSPKSSRATRPSHRLPIRLTVPAVFIAVLIASQVLFGVLGLSRIRSSRSELAYLDARVTEAELQMTDDKPVFVTTVPPAGRWMWHHLDQGRWLWVEPSELPSTMQRLSELDVAQVALISLDRDNDIGAATASYYQLHPDADPTEPVIVLEEIVRR